MNKCILTLAVTAALFSALDSRAADSLETAGAALDATAHEAGEAIRAQWEDGTLFVFGTDDHDSIAVSSYGGELEVNAGLVPVEGGIATVADTWLIVLHGFGGDDQLRIESWGGVMPAAGMDGGEGNDLLIGGDGDDLMRGGAGIDVLIGGRGNDVMLGHSGNDYLIWQSNYGGTAATMEGGEGFDFVQVNGSNTAGDDFSIEPDGDRVRFQRNNLGLFTLDIGTVENIDAHGLGGADQMINFTGLEVAVGLYGGWGDDWLAGGTGNDRIDGGPGTDFCDGGRGRDEIIDCERKR